MQTVPCFDQFCQLLFAAIAKLQEEIPSKGQCLALHISLYGHTMVLTLKIHTHKALWQDFQLYHENGIMYVL